MSIVIRLFLLIIVVCFFSCNEKSNYSTILEVILNENADSITIANEPSIRGIDVFDSNIAWLSGSESMFARTTDGGENWELGKINDDVPLDFRDIHVFSNDTAIVISAGLPARIYKTTNGGDNWSLKFESTEDGVFFNSFDFWDNQRGIVCSDPVEGEFLFYTTEDGGETWQKVNTDLLPKPLSIEAGFAASGTSVITADGGKAFYGTGGDSARIIITQDYGLTWKAISTPMKAMDESLGIYSLAMINDSIIVATGGNWQTPTIADSNFAISTDCGKTWQLTEQMPNGFRSCVKQLSKDDESLIVCGRNGVDISTDFGQSWIKTKLPGYFTMDISPNGDFIVFAGAKGRVASYCIK